MAVGWGSRAAGEEMSEERLSEVRSALQGEQRQNAQLYQKAAAHAFARARVFSTSL